jgi:DNA-binding PadR family transcriptional regulator
VDAEGMRGHIDTIVLAALQRGAAHGYALVRAVDTASDGVFLLGEGTIYPSLHRLERDGLIAGSWGAHAGRRRRIYEITAAGRVALGERRTAFDQFAHGMRSLLDGAP